MQKASDEMTRGLSGAIYIRSTLFGGGRNRTATATESFYGTERVCGNNMSYVMPGVKLQKHTCNYPVMDI